MFKSKLLFFTSIATLIVSVLGSFLVQRQILSSTAQQLTNAVSTDLRTGFYWKVTETLTPLAGGQFQQIYWERTSSIQHALSLLPNRSVTTIRVAGSLTIKLQDANKTIGRLTFDYDTLPGLFGGLFIWLIQMSVLLLFVFQRSNSERLRERLRIDAAIARTTQMLAHDVRKPFALFRMTIDRVKTAGTPEQVQQALQEALPEVERSLANVNGLISDVLNVGGEFRLVLKSVSLAPIVDDVIGELRKLHPTRSLKVQVSISPETWVEADDTRLPRVFLNILSNAIEAVESPDVHLWVSAQPDPMGGVEVRVGNLGSFIPAEARSKLFDLFYTSGKKGGTGLGLAIVKKIIEGHGSSVQCTSERTDEVPQGKVEFAWKLRAAGAPSEPQDVAHSDSSVQFSKPVPLPMPSSSNQPSVSHEVPQHVRPNVVFLDDSPLARWVWEAKLKAKAKVISFASPGDFWKAVENNALELESLHTIITDHYFAPEEKVTGVEFAAELRQQGFMGRILLASNGEFDAERLSGILDKIVDKQPVDWDLLNS